MPKAKPKTTSNVEEWLMKQSSKQQSAIENASRHFNEKDSLTVNTLEALYAQESSFGKNRRDRGITGAAGDFQLEKTSAKRMGLAVSTKNDQRFDIDDEWDDVKHYLKSAGASDRKTREIQEYVEKVLGYEEEFSKKSQADKNAKTAKPKKIKKLPEGGHWITLGGNHIFIEDK